MSRRSPRLERMAKPGPQRRALARVGDLVKDRSTSCPGPVRGIVTRTVVNDHDGQVSPSSLDDRADPGPFLVGRDQCEDGPVRTWHGQSIAASAILRTDSGTLSTLHHIRRFRPAAPSNGDLR